MGIILVLQSEVAHVLHGEYLHIHHWMNINPITLNPHIITKDLSKEESEGYTEFLQTYDIQFNNLIRIWTLNIPGTTIVKLKKRRKFALREITCQCQKFTHETPSIHHFIQMNDEVDLQPWNIHG